MRAVVALFILLAGLRPLAPAGDKDAVQWKLDYFHKTWGIQFKSAKVDNIGQEARLLMEFTKDVPNRKALRTELAPPVDLKPQEIPFWFYLFDADNVVAAKVPLKRIEGEITGKAGEAFRMVFDAQSFQLWSTIRKVEARATEKEKNAERERR